LQQRLNGLPLGLQTLTELEGAFGQFKFDESGSVVKAPPSGTLYIPLNLSELMSSLGPSWLLYL
jgi:hypothetical protein